MKLKLVMLNGEKILYCANGTVMKADDKVLNRLLTEFDHPTRFKGKDGFWNILVSEMDHAPGETLAIVDNSNSLVVYSTEAFLLPKVVEEYVSAKEYAALHKKAHSLIRRHCDKDRIPGAIKNSTGWLIPKDAPYPGRKKREVKKK